MSSNIVVPGIIIIRFFFVFGSLFDNVSFFFFLVYSIILVAFDVIVMCQAKFVVFQATCVVFRDMLVVFQPTKAVIPSKLVLLLAAVGTSQANFRTVVAH